MTVDREAVPAINSVERCVVLGGGRDRCVGGCCEPSASPRYRVYQLQFRFPATTLTLLFTVSAPPPGTLPR